MRSQDYSKYYRFQKHNLAEARLAIKSFLANKQKYNFSDEQVQFLEELRDWIKALAHSVQKTVTTSAKLPGAELTAYKKDIQTGFDLTEEHTTSIRDSIQNQLNNKNNGNEAYLFLLKKIDDCCASVQSTLQKSKVNFDSTFKIISFTLERARQFGGVAIPLAQNFDPMASLRDEGKELREGFCYGMVNRWGELIKKFGFADPEMFLNTKVYKRQKLRDILIGSEIQETNYLPLENKAILYLAPLKDSKVISHIALGQKNNPAHAIGIRRIPITNEIEMIDGNFALFSFADEQDFTDWFTLHLFSYRLMRSDYVRAAFYSMGSQPDNAKSSLSIKPTPNHFQIESAWLQEIKQSLNLSYQKKQMTAERQGKCI